MAIFTSLALGASKVLKGVGRVGKSGARRGRSFFKRKSEGAIEKKQPDIKVKTKVVSVARLFDTKSLESQSKAPAQKSSGVESIDSALDKIDNTLAGIIATVEDRSNLQRRSIRNKNIRDERARKNEREDKLESKKPHKFGMKIPRLFKSAFNAIQNFFSNILIGGLLILILGNMDKIIETFKKVYTKMKDLVTQLGDFLQPIWRAIK